MKYRLATYLFIALCALTGISFAQEAPCQWTYANVAGVATATYCGNAVVKGNLTPGLPGVYEQVYGVKRDGVTDDTAAFITALSHCNNAILYEGSGTSIRSTWNVTAVPPSNCIIVGEGRGATVDSYSGTGVYVNVFTQNNPNFTVRDLTVKTSGPISSGMQFTLWCNDNLTMHNVEFDGQMTVSGTTLTSGISQFVKPCTTGSQNHLLMDQNYIHAAYAIYSKDDANTSNQTDIRIQNNLLVGLYGGDINLNSPNGSQSNIMVSKNQHYNPVFTDQIGKSEMFGVGIAFGTTVDVDGDQFVGNYYDAIHIEGNVLYMHLRHNSGIISTDGISIIQSNHDTGGTWYSPQYFDIADNTFTQSGTPFTPLTGGFPNFCIGFGMQNAQNGNVNYGTVHHNVCNGSGFGAGLAVNVPQIIAANSMKVDDNRFVQTAIGFDFIGSISMGGNDWINNTCNATPVCVQGVNVHLGSLALLNMDPAAVTTQVFKGVNATLNQIVVDRTHWEFAGVSLAGSASQTYNLYRFGANDRYAGNISVYTTDYFAQRAAGNYYSSVNWDGSTSPTFTARGTFSNGMTDVAGLTAGYLAVTATNTIGSTNTALQSVDITGFYAYYGN